jgi:hypothetical protein
LELFELISELKFEPIQIRMIPLTNSFKISQVLVRIEIKRKVTTRDSNFEEFSSMEIWTHGILIHE